MKLAVFIFAITFLLLPTPLLAQEEFFTDVDVTYEVFENGDTIVTHDISLENEKTGIYAQDYTFILENAKPRDFIAFNKDGDLRSSIFLENGKTAVKVEFDNPVVGKGEGQVFSIRYVDENLLTKLGDVWEIAIPRVATESNFDSYDVQLIVPKAFQAEAYVSPRADQVLRKSSASVYIFNKGDAARQGVTAAFGSFQVYDFDLKYHLENPLDTETEIEIAIPPDAASQKTLYESISPEPINVRIDEDGNWLAMYSMQGRSVLDVNVKGSAQIFAASRPFFGSTDETLEKLKKEVELITKVEFIGAEGLNSTRDIYNYLLSEIEFSPLENGKEPKRRGAIETLETKTAMSSRDYVDAFVALARSINIPARAVIGFAQSDNAEAYPLTHVSGVLHSWAEYWEAGRNIWVPVDPTWGVTTGGKDHFNVHDLKRIVFAINGVSSGLPLPAGSFNYGSNPGRDVNVVLSALPEYRDASPEISVTKHKGFYVGSRKFPLEIYNPGPTALYDREIEVLFDDKVIETIKVEVLLPYSKKESSVSVPVGILGTRSPERIEIRFAGSSQDIVIDKYGDTINQLFIILAVILGLSGIMAYRFGIKIWKA